MSKLRNSIKEELFTIKDYIKTPKGKKMRPESYGDDKGFMSEVYPKLSDIVTDDLEHILLRLHKSKMSLGEIAKEVITRSFAYRDINENDKEENKMSKNENKSYVIGEVGKEKKHKSTLDIEDALKSVDDTLEMALEEKKKEEQESSKDKGKKNKESKKESSSDKTETESEKDEIEVSDIEKAVEIILNNIDVDDDEDEEDEEEDDDFFGDDDYEEEIEEDEFDDDDDDYDYYGRTPEYDQYEKDLESFIKFQEHVEELRDKLKAAKDKLSKEVYKEQKDNILKLKKKRDDERDRLSKLNLQFFKDGTYERINRHKLIPFKEGSKEWKQAIRDYDKASVL